MEEQSGQVRAFSIVGFVLSFIAFLNIAGLIFSIIAWVSSRKAGRGNGLALAGIIISVVGIVFTAAVLIFLVPVLVDAAQTCARLGEGVHVVGGSTYTCAPGSFSVHRPA